MGPPSRLPSAQEAKERATRLLDDEIRALPARRGSHLPIAAEVIEGSPGETLARAAGAADLLVLGSHGYSRVRRTVHGSVSEECVRKATCLGGRRATDPAARLRPGLATEAPCPVAVVPLAQRDADPW